MGAITLFRSYVRELQDEFEDEYNYHIDIVDIQDEFLAWMRRQKEADFKKALWYVNNLVFNYFYEEMQDYLENYNI